MRSSIPAPLARRPRPRVSRLAGYLGAGLLAAAGLSACGGGNGGPPTLHFYNFPDNSGAIAQAVERCTAQSGGKYTIEYNKLPTAADGQRQQLVRRLAARDSSMDILGLDVTWAPEFAEAGWILPWTGANRAKATEGTLKAPLETATWKGRLYAVPYNSNTQLLWYRSDLVDKPPATWDEMIDDAIRLAKEGKPHRIEIQGAQYEGVVVWFNTLVASAGGSILNEQATAPALGKPARKALQIMKRLASSPAADPSLSVQMEDQNRLAMEAGTAAFELNYPFVYPSMKTNKPALFKNFKWAQYPAVSAGEPSHVTIGGIDMAISKYSKHPDLAFEAALCLRDADNQKVAAVKGGLPPTLESLYSDPDLAQSYPFHEDILQALQNASVRPKTPAYQNISIVISHSISPPSKINPDKTESTIASQIKDALASKGLIP
ncbi:ABC transporter substrate-binding protein [Jatrophihabitans cynanchi]|uniref:ABC transporter substrate-binding protein n=1 Tax=Jatrophihabitans cynanchi TaxID=2944128 RepID=A0ABY7JWM8_9ACTN|nr:ABC transporter substrate-binding protein [Jatrophihabitans sp. SB3-54]WAX56718.1 ABC transporter substrate-binding protein [Jatrophihabitans sp. SB3-54]